MFTLPNVISTTEDVTLTIGETIHIDRATGTIKVFVTGFDNNTNENIYVNKEVTVNKDEAICREIAKILDFTFNSIG